jgi:hypothetical protein
VLENARSVFGEVILHSTVLDWTGEDNSVSSLALDLDGIVKEFFVIFGSRGDDM